MIEIDIRNFINDNLDYPAYLEKPTGSNNPYFVIEKVGGSEAEYIKVATVAIQIYAPSLYLAMSITEILNDAMLNDFVTLPNVSRVELNSTYNFTDTTTKQYRYQSIFEIFHYGGNE